VTKSIFWCFYSNGQCYVHTLEKDIPCKDVWEASKLLWKLRSSTLEVRGKANE